MHIVEKIAVDKAGRLSLTKVFEEIPEMVVPSFDTKTKKLFFLEVKNGNEPNYARKIDDRNRISLPKTLTEELGKEYYLCAESADEHFVFPCKYLFVG